MDNACIRVLLSPSSNHPVLYYLRHYSAILWLNTIGLFHWQTTSQNYYQSYVSDCYDFKPSLDVLKSAKMACVNYNESEINCVNGIVSFFLNMYEHIFQHYVTFLQNGTSRAMTHHHSPGWWVMTHHNISRGWQVWMT